MCQTILSFTVLGTIDEDVQFYYRNISKIPSTLASIEYFISYDQNNISSSLVKDIYTTKNDFDFHTEYTNRTFGQLRNEDIHTYLRPDTYRSTTCSFNDDSGVVVLQNFTRTIDKFIL